MVAVQWKTANASKFPKGSKKARKKSKPLDVENARLVAFAGGSLGMTDAPFYPDFAKDDYRRDLETDRIVRLLRPFYKSFVEAEQYGYQYEPWLVEDVGTGQIYTRMENKLWGPVYNALEAFALVAEQAEENPRILGD